MSNNAEKGEFEQMEKKRRIGKSGYKEWCTKMVQERECIK